MTTDPFDRAWYAPLDPPGWDTSADARRMAFPELLIITRLVTDLATALGRSEATIRLTYGLPPQDTQKTRHNPDSGPHTRRQRQAVADETTRSD